ncbi:MAG: hypothetical protein LQ346_008869 [Caloplaca aetnensis]|nr:MAG: hypothetical protein LQ346_008869 [Caloplaca aetnensis]
MASRPSYKDYGIPDSLAVPTGEYIQGWDDAKAANLSRIILYNLDVVYSMQKEILRRLDGEDNSQDQKLTDEQLAQKLQLHEWNHRDRTMEVNHLPSRGNGSPAVGGSGAIRPK